MTSIRRKLRPHLYIVLSLLVAGILLALAIRGLDWSQMLKSLQKARLSNLGFAVGLLSLSFFFRGVRWGILLSEERTIAPVTLFWATSLGYLGNYFLPARAGELIRSLSLAHKTAINVGYILATALTERIFDALVLVIISLAALSTLSDVPGDLVIATRTMAIIGVLGMLAVFVAPRLEPLVKTLLSSLNLPAQALNKILPLIEQFLLGMRACQHTTRALGFTMMTALSWSIDTLVVIQVGQALDMSLSAAESLLLLAALGLSSAIPSTPGYIGIYQFVAVLVLTRYDYSRHEALSFILVFQAVSYLVALVFGLIGLWQLNASQFWRSRALASANQAELTLNSNSLMGDKK